MEDRLVQNCSQILRLLLNSNLNVNQIIKDTGIYKNYVFEANKFLEHSKLVERFLNKEVHQQKEFIKLTPFGRKLAEFIESADKFDKSFKRLKETTKNNFSIFENTELKSLHSILKSRGWNNDEINHIEEYASSAIDFEIGSLSVVVDGITNRYALYLLRFNPNKYANDLLEKVMIDKLSSFLMTRIENNVKGYYFTCKHCGEKNLLKEETPEHRINEILEENSNRLFDFIGDTVHIPFNSRFITKEVGDVIRCLFSIIDLPRKLEEQKIKKEIQILTDLEATNPSPNPHVEKRKKLMAFCTQLNRLT